MNKYLVFTSAGDNSCIDRWVSGEQPEFDLCIVYYGDKDCRFESLAKYFFRRKAGKFQNLHYVFSHSVEILTGYDSILAIDDDIQIDCAAINKLFKLREQYGITILQPSFDPRGKISHAITGFSPFTKLRYTNFVEITAPVIETEFLLSFLEVFDNRVNCCGVDCWFCHKATVEHKKIAVVDDITCLNPYDLDKGGVREIDKLFSRKNRIDTWKKVKAENNLTFKESDFVCYGGVYDFNIKRLFLYCYLNIAALVLRVYRKFKRLRTWVINLLNK